MLALAATQVQGVLIEVKSRPLVGKAKDTKDSLESVVNNLFAVIYNC